MPRQVMLVAILALCLMANGQAQGQRPQMAEDVFKNVQILKGIPVDEFMDTMGMIAASTGMNCVNCHASDNTTSWDKFAEDTPLKETARKMLLMVNTINKDNFKGVRHRGVALGCTGFRFIGQVLFETFPLRPPSPNVLRRCSNPRVWVKMRRT